MEPPPIPFKPRADPTATVIRRHSTDANDVVVVVDGPFFDLELDSSEENDVTWRLSSSSADVGVVLFKRIEDEPSLSYSKPLGPPSLMIKPVTKFRYFMLRFRNRIMSPSRRHKVEPERARSVPADNEKNVIHRYISKIKPLYVRVSKRYTDILGPKEQLVPPECKYSGQFLNSPAANIRKLLRKSRSASATVAADPPPPCSLIQQEDEIESAIAFCKKSFYSNKDHDSDLVRSDIVKSSSDPGEANRSINRRSHFQESGIN